MDDRSEEVLAVAVTFLVVCWVAVGLRVHCRLHVVKSFGMDDLSLVILQLVYTSYLVGQLVAWWHGTGQHKSALSEADNSQALMFWFICELLYVVCTSLLKIATGWFLLRLAADARHLWLLRGLMVSTALLGGGYFFMVLFQCRPSPRVFWEESPRAAPGERCWGDGVVLGLTYAASAVNCLADWAFGLMPVLVVRTLNMPRGARILVACLMSFAAVYITSSASIATIVRMVYIPTLLNGDDFLYETTDIAIWSTIEVGVGITTLSVAALHPLVTQWRCRRGLLPIPATAAAAAAAGAAASPFPSDTPLSPSRNCYVRTHSNDPPRRHRSDQRQSGSPLKLRPDDTILYISSASGLSSSSPPPAPSRFGLCHWIEEGVGGRGLGGHGDGIGSYYYRSNGNHDAGSTTELADWKGDGGETGGERTGITKTTEVSQQSLHRLSRIDAVLMTDKEAS
ncbi:hypothetical protein PG985_003480 [Apiospora marii]|uniref:uncharacterized protein n=1 Tax=Apiospora marii TaxID=335849 RepID=UPI00313045C5